ncbi:MAG TPA: single-stranded DNA-binding protein [Candidatus Acidoferrales bacterium]|nr:single-stranded DNA-binding protein [Candidatus Acidoferrales bacterium]
MAGNRIELDGRLAAQPEVRVTPAGTPVLRFTVDCSVPGEELTLTVVMTGDSALAAKALLEPGRPLRVVGRLRALRAGLKATASGPAFEVVAESVELADS